MNEKPVDKDPTPWAETWEEVMGGLSAPMEYEVKPKEIRREGTGFRALGLGYVSRHHVQNRLDEVLGPGRWSVDFRVVDIANKIVECTIRVVLGDGSSASKSDVGSPQGMDTGDEWKGAYSDAFKRAATMWGVCRFLYETKAEWLPCEVWTSADGLPRLTPNGKMQFKKWLPYSKEEVPPVTLKSGGVLPPETPEENIDYDFIAKELVRKYGAVRCKSCGGDNVFVKKTRGTEKTPSHVAVWCRNTSCETQKFKGYSYPVDAAGKFNQPRVEQVLAEETPIEELPF